MIFNMKSKVVIFKKTFSCIWNGYIFYAVVSSSFSGYLFTYSLFELYIYTYP